MFKLLSRVALLAVLATALAASQAAFAGDAQQKPAPVKIVWGS